MCGLLMLIPGHHEALLRHFAAEAMEEPPTDSPAGLDFAEPAASGAKAGLFDSASPANGTLTRARNVPPTGTVWIVRHRQHLPPATKPNTERIGSRARWGLIPHWAKDRTIASKTFNARSETAHEKPSFRVALSRRRCVLPVHGFYEWRREGKLKQPFLIRLADGNPMAMAGLFERWKDPETGEAVESCSVLTIGPNRFMEQIHDRMPVILGPDDVTSWLNPDNGTDDVRALLRPCPDGWLAGVAVDLKPGTPGHIAVRPELGELARVP